MESNDTNTAVDTVEGLRIEVDLDLSLEVYRLGGKGSPSQRHVAIGRVAAVTHDQEAYDHDGLPEVYLAGEPIAKSGFLKKSECLVAELAEKLGTVWVRGTQYLAGISLREQDTASAEFRYDLQLRDPILLLSKEPRWRTAEGRERLQKSVQDLIHRQVRSSVTDNVQQLWSHPDIGEVSGQLFVGLDRTMRAWGIRVSPETHRHLAYRAYPPMLHEVVLQFGTAETELLCVDDAVREDLLKRLRLHDSDWVEMERIRRQVGPGAGLFKVARHSRDPIDPLIEWLGSEAQSAIAAANMLKEIVYREHGAEQLDLTELVLLSAFRNPLLGLGERRDTEHGLVDTSLFGRLEDRLYSALGVLQ